MHLKISPTHLENTTTNQKNARADQQRWPIDYTRFRSVKQQHFWPAYIRYTVVIGQCSGPGESGRVYCSFPEWLAEQILIVLSRELWISRVGQGIKLSFKLPSGVCYEIPVAHHNSSEIPIALRVWEGHQRNCRNGRTNFLVHFPSKQETSSRPHAHTGVSRQRTHTTELRAWPPQTDMSVCVCLCVCGNLWLCSNIDATL